MVLFGTRIRVCINNVELINYNDKGTSLTYGKIGLLGHTGSTGKDKVRYDNVVVNTINP
jgi:hypothetical protein